MPGRVWFTPFLKQCFVTLGVCMDVIGHGCIIGYPAVLLPQLKENPTIPLSEDESSWIASILGITMLIGIILTPPAMGRLGRKKAHYIVILSLLAAWFILGFATTVTELMLGRTLHGFSFGMFTPLRSVLIGEYTSPKNRGAFLTTISLAQGLGIGLVHLIGSLVDWKTTSLICVSFTFISLLMTIYSPETPSWLADRGRYDECRKAFHWLRGDTENQELEEMIDARITSKKRTNTTLPQNNFRIFLATVRKKEFYKPCFIMFNAYLMFSFSGAIMLAAYSIPIISTMIGPNNDANTWMVALDAQRLFTNTVAIFIINRVNRRTMMFTTLALNISSFVAISVYIFLKCYNYIKYDGLWIPGLLLLCHYVSIAVGMVPLPGVIAGEVFPMAYRSIGNSIGTCSLAAFMFLNLKTFPDLERKLGLHGAYLAYAALMLYCLI